MLFSAVVVVQVVLISSCFVVFDLSCCVYYPCLHFRCCLVCLLAFYVLTFAFICFVVSVCLDLVFDFRACLLCVLFCLFGLFCLLYLLACFVLFVFLLFSSCFWLVLFCLLFLFVCVVDFLFVFLLFMFCRLPLSVYVFVFFGAVFAFRACFVVCVVLFACCVSCVFIVVIDLSCFGYCSWLYGLLVLLRVCLFFFFFRF